MTNAVATTHEEQHAPVTINGGLPVSLQMITDDALYQRCWSVAQAMAKSPGLVAPALMGKPEACMSVVMIALEWRLNPYMVARSIYEPAKGAKIGFEGKLIRAIAEASGKLAKPIEYEYYGDWSNVMGKFERRESQRQDGDGRKKYYMAATYTNADEQGLGVKVKLHLHGEAQPREFSFDLLQAQPRNSTLWATDPKTQIMYTATRRAIDAVAPELLMGMSFDDDRRHQQESPQFRDVTPAQAPPPSSEPDPLVMLDVEHLSAPTPPPIEGADAGAPVTPSSGSPGNSTDEGSLLGMVNAAHEREQGKQIADTGERAKMLGTEDEICQRFKVGLSVCYTGKDVDEYVRQYIDEPPFVVGILKPLVEGRRRELSKQ